MIASARQSEYPGYTAKQDVKPFNSGHHDGAVSLIIIPTSQFQCASDVRFWLKFRAPTDQLVRSSLVQTRVHTNGLAKT